MKSGKKQQKSGDFLRLPIPWDELDQFFRKDDIKEYARNIDMSTLVSITKSANRESFTQSALKSLKKTDPKNATRERAELLVDRMKEFAEGIIQKTMSTSSN